MSALVESAYAVAVGGEDWSSEGSEERSTPSLAESEEDPWELLDGSEACGARTLLSEVVSEDTTSAVVGAASLDPVEVPCISGSADSIEVVVSMVESSLVKVSVPCYRRLPVWHYEQRPVRMTLAQPSSSAGCYPQSLWPTVEWVSMQVKQAPCSLSQVLELSDQQLCQQAPTPLEDRRAHASPQSKTPTLDPATAEQRPALRAAGDRRCSPGSCADHSS